MTVNNIQTFLTLQEAGQSQASVENKAYNSSAHFSCVQGMEIYIKAIDKSFERIQLFEDLLKKINSVKSSNFSKQQEEYKSLLTTLTEKYTSIRQIFDEFIKGFSVSHDKNAQELMVLLYRGFDHCLMLLDIAYVSHKTQHIADIRVKLGKIKELFEKSLETLKAQEESANTSQTNDNDVSITLEEMSA